MSPLHTGAMVRYLNRRLSGDNEPTAYGDELPDEVIQGLRQPGHSPVVCVNTMGGPPRAGLLSLETRRFDIHVIADLENYASYAECFRIEDVIKVYMEELSQSGAGTAEGLKGAIRENGPFRFRNPENRWRVVHSTWLVQMANDLP